LPYWNFFYLYFFFKFFNCQLNFFEFFFGLIFLKYLFFIILSSKIFFYFVYVFLYLFIYFLVTCLSVFVCFEWQVKLIVLELRIARVFYISLNQHPLITHFTPTTIRRIARNKMFAIVFNKKTVEH